MEYYNLNFDSDDRLNRKVFIKNIMHVIEEWKNLKHENNSLVLSLDATWGAGKSYLLNMWRNWLISDDCSYKNYAVAYYNAWENDDCDNAFIPLVYKLQQMDVNEDNNSVLENVKSRSASFIKSCGVALLKDGIKKVIGEETSNLISEGIDSAAEENVENFFKQYTKFIDEKKRFKNSLTELIPSEGKLIIFIDELDRCRPTFAVDTLEIVKHYFNIQDIVFIVAVDLAQLSHSIATLYGNGMDSAGYLRRFFDVNINLPIGDISEYVKLVFKDNIDKVQWIPDNFIETFINLYIKLNLSLRDINKITNNFIIFCLFYKDVLEGRPTANPNDNLKILEIYLYFMILKYKYPEIYSLILRHDFMAYDNAPKNWEVLEKKYFISSTINEMLKSIQTGQAHNKDDSLIKKFGLYGVNSVSVTFSEHIERTLEMFS